MLHQPPVGGIAITATGQRDLSERTLQTLRDTLSQDSRILASLDPRSEAYHRLHARIEHQTTELLDYQDQLEQQRQTMAALLAEQRRQDETAGRIGGGLVFTVVGAVVTHAAWGSWWLLLGIVLLAVGLTALFVKDL